MTFESIRLAIESRMAQWTAAPIEYDGAPKSPAVQAAIDAKESWVRLTIIHGDSNTASVASAPEVRRTGLVSVQIFTPENRGSRPAAVLADSISAHIEYYRSGDFETLAASVQRIGPSDGWYQYNISCPFRAGC